MGHISIIPDYRQAWKMEHKLSDILLLTICAVISGAEGWEDIEDFGETHPDFLKQYGDFENGIPVHDTIARVVSCISPAKFHECFINWMRDCHSSDDKDVIAIDGKTLRHSYDKSRRRGAIHVISAFSTMHSLVIGQIKTDEKSNEITAIPELLNMLEEEIRADRVSSESRAWLAQCGLTVEQLARQVEPEYTPARKAHLYHCDHRGLPLALISEDGNTAWSAEYDEWGNQLNEENPHHVYQPYRLPGQQHDEESGLYYNRHRYYDPLQGRYITQDPMGLKGGWNLYQYPLNPLQQIDPMGLLQTWDDARSGACTGGVCGVLSRIIGPSKFDSTADAALDALKETQNRSLCNDMEYSGIVCKDTNGKYFASKAETDNLRKESYPLKRKCPTGTDRVAAYHTHGADSHGDYVDEFFSSSDKNLVRSKDNNLEAFYLATPDGRFEALNNKGEYIFIRNSVPGLSSVCIPYHD
ncbi:ISAs1 family transposase [Escherichia coli]|uniref:ISAs1 family transposase n=36 Tax=Escherichia coli TaxID=562 RepID=UPI003D9C5195